MKCVVLDVSRTELRLVSCATAKCVPLPESACHSSWAPRSNECEATYVMQFHCGRASCGYQASVIDCRKQGDCRDRADLEWPSQESQTPGRLTSGIPSICVVLSFVAQHRGPQVAMKTSRAMISSRMAGKNILDDKSVWESKIVIPTVCLLYPRIVLPNIWPLFETESLRG